MPLNVNAFQLSAKGSLRTKAAERKAKSRAVTNVMKAVFDPLHTKEQQVLALREAINHKDMNVHSASAGLLLDNKLFLFLLTNIKKVIQLATTTTKKRGKPTDDMRSLLHTIVLATLPTPGSRKLHSSRQIAKALGLSETTYRQAKKAVTSKRAALEGIHGALVKPSVLFSQVVKRKQWRIMCPNVKAKSHDYIRRHPNVIVSPIKGDTVTIADPSDASKKIKVPKRLRQISIRELHNDLIKNVPECTASTGKILVSDTNLRANMPPEVKRMSDRYKEMCSCITCLEDVPGIFE